jgi:hypothetical protein
MMRRGFAGGPVTVRRFARRLVIDGDASVMSPLNATGMAIEQEAVHLTRSTPLVISGQRLALEDSVDTPVAVWYAASVARASKKQ